MTKFSTRTTKIALLSMIFFAQILSPIAQEDEYVIRLIGNRVFEVDFEQGRIESFTEEINLLLHVGNFSVSNNGRYAIAWDADISGSFTLIDLLAAEVIFSELVLVRDRDFITVDWLFDDQFALVKIGVKVGVVDYANRINLVTQSWLVNTVTSTIIDWYWDCNSIVHLLMTDDFAYRCNLFDASKGLFQPNQVFLTAFGLENLERVEYQSIYERYSEHHSSPSFASQFDIVAYTDISEPPFEVVSVYSLSQENFDLGRYNQAIEGSTRTLISPDGRFLAEIGSCSGNKIIGCLRITDWSSGELILDSNEIQALESMTNAFDVFWMADMAEIVVAGSDNGNLSSHVWHLSMQGELLAELELSRSISRIITVHDP